MSKQDLKICPVCKKGFSYRTRYGKDAITCSDNCKQTMVIVRSEDPEEWSNMVREAETMRKPARQSCALYDTGSKYRICSPPQVSPPYGALWRTANSISRRRMRDGLVKMKWRQRKNEVQRMWSRYVFG